MMYNRCYATNTNSQHYKSVVRIRTLDQQQRNIVFYGVERGHISIAGRVTSAD
jgi:hypothetical protein